MQTTPTIDAAEIRALVREGSVHRRVYTDPRLFELEMERIFGRTWLFVAHDSMIPSPGDFVRARTGVTEVLVTRDDEGGVHVVKNSCAHRGARLCTVPRGNARSLVCPYHAWTYRLDGALASIPHREGYAGGFERSEGAKGLVRTPRVADYRGFWFASWAATGPDLTDFLGPMTEAIDNLVDRSPRGVIEQAGGCLRLQLPGNWKLHHENANDTVHPGFVHRSSVASARAEAGCAPAFDGGQTRAMMEANGFGPREWEGLALHAVPGGHSYMGGFYENGLLPAVTDDPVMDEYRGVMAQARGEKRAGEILGLDRFNNLIYPNLNINAQFHQLRVVHPVAPGLSLLQSYCFRLGGAPEALFHRAVRFLNTLGSPASMIFSDDVEIFSRVQSGLGARGVEWLDTSRGLGLDVEDQERGGASVRASELPVRGQLGAWLAYMTDPR